VGEDIVFDTVDPEVRITNPIASLEVNTTYQLEYTFLNNVGEEVAPTSIQMTSTDESKAKVNQSGLIEGLTEGPVTIRIEASHESQSASTTLVFEVTDDGTMVAITERTGSVSPQSSYGLKGSFQLFEDGDDLVLSFDDQYRFSGAPGPYIYLTNNANSIPVEGASYEIGEMTVMSGAHEYRIPLSDVSLNQYSVVYFYCKPFMIRLGFGEFDN
ncbi:MAG: Ig-like domain-containing protein, partial [Bacteroidota bacterium]